MDGRPVAAAEPGHRERASFEEEGDKPAGNRVSLQDSELPPRGTGKHAADRSAGRRLCEAWARRALRAEWLFARTFRDLEITARKSVGAVTQPEGEKTMGNETSRRKGEHLVPEHSAEPSASQRARARGVETCQLHAADLGEPACALLSAPQRPPIPKTARPHSPAPGTSSSGARNSPKGQGTPSLRCLHVQGSISTET